MAACAYVPGGVLLCSHAQHYEMQCVPGALQISKPCAGLPAGLGICHGAGLRIRHGAGLPPGTGTTLKAGRVVN